MRVAMFQPTLVHLLLVLLQASFLACQLEEEYSSVVLPYEGFELKEPPTCNIIEGSCYVEASATRCKAPTKLTDPSRFAPSFLLMTAQGNRTLYFNSSAAEILHAGYDPSKYTTFFVHGFTQHYDRTAWIIRTVQILERHQLLASQNFLLVNWHQAAQGIYMDVAARVSGVGSYLAHFLNKLVDLGTDRLKIHLVGHSAGAQVIGFAGKRLRPPIGHITAIDPAGPCFNRFANGPTERIAADDARQVEVYHYDDGFLGISGQHGQFDVYVNGGRSQPESRSIGRTVIRAIITTLFSLDRIYSESHTRGALVASADLSASRCELVAYECRDYAAFERGECAHCDQHNNQCLSMGLEHQYGRPKVENPLRTVEPKKMYLKTGGHDIYCLHHYQILVSLSEQAATEGLQLKLELVDEHGSQLEATELNNRLQSGLYSQLLTVDGERPAPRFVAGRLERAKSVADQLLQSIRVEINFMSSAEFERRQALSSVLCASELGETIVLVEC